MAFYCVCNHTRGKHDNPTKREVGKCNVIVNDQTNAICGCRHYRARDRKLSQLKDYQKTGLAYMIIAFGSAFGLCAWIANAEESIMYYGFMPLHLGAAISGLLVLLCWYLKFGESYFARIKAECLE